MIEMHLAFFAEYWGWTVPETLDVPVSRRMRLLKIKQDALHAEREEMNRAKARR